MAANEEAARLTGYSVAELVGLEVDQLVPAGLEERHKINRAEFSQNPYERAMHNRERLALRHKQGSHVAVVANLHVIEGSDLVRCFVKIAEDSTEASKLDGIRSIILKLSQSTGQNFDSQRIIDIAVGDSSKIFDDKVVVFWNYKESDETCVPSEYFKNGLPLETMAPITDASMATHIGLAIHTLNDVVVEKSADTDGCRLPLELLNAGYTGGVAAVVHGKYAPVGVLAVYFQSDNEFVDQDQQSLRQIADAVGFSLANQRAEKELRNELEIQRVLTEINRIISSSESIDAVFDRIVEVISEVLPCTRTLISTLMPDATTAICRHNWAVEGPGGIVGTMYQVEGSQLGAIIANGEPLLIGEHNIDVYAKLIPRIALDIENNLRSQVTVPLLVDGVVIGIFGVRSTDRDAYCNKHVQIATLVASQIAGEIEKDGLHSQLQRHASELQVLTEISRAVNENLDLGHLYSRLADTLSEAIPYDRFMVTKTVTESNGQRFDTTIFSRGIEIEGLSIGSRRLTWSPDQPIPQLEINTAATLSIRENPSLSEDLISAGLASRLRAIIGSGDEPQLAIALLSREVEAYDQQHADLLSRICEQIAPAIANANEHEALLRLTDSFERAQHALDSTTDMVAIHDSDTKYIYVNDAFVEGTGFPRDDIIGRTAGFQNSYPSRTNETDIWDIARTEGQWSGSSSRFRKDGTRYYEQATITPIFDSDGEISSFVVIKRDVTDQIEADALLSQSAAKQDLISVVEHEVRSPLGAVINFVDLLRKSEERRPKVIEALKMSTTELASIIDDLGRAVIGSGAQMTVEKQPENISVLLANSIIRSSLPAQKKKLNLSLSISNDPKVVELEIDASRIAQVFSNLITNAVRYTPSGSDIDITLDQSGRFTRFRIYNQGTGVAASDLGMVTHPFFRGTNSSESNDVGSGIGLALSSAIVQAHDGYMSVRSEPDEFFEVEVLLPNLRLI